VFWSKMQAVSPQVQIVVIETKTLPGLVNKELEERIQNATTRDLTVRGRVDHVVAVRLENSS
jgi:hypothetical protein